MNLSTRNLGYLSVRPQRRVWCESLEQRTLLSAAVAAVIVGTHPKILTFTVTNANTTGTGSLDQAIKDADVAVDTHILTKAIIKFNIPVAASKAAVIRPGGSIYELSHGITIDGTTEPTTGIVSGPKVVLDGSANPSASGLQLDGGDVINGIGIENFSGFGIVDDSDNIVENSIISNDGSTGVVVAAAATADIFSHDTIDHNAGHGIRNDGSITLIDCTVSNNTSGHSVVVAGLDVGNVGGGIYANPNATTTIIDSTFYKNSGFAGGGIYNDAGGTLSVTNSTFNANTATGSPNQSGEGGGIFCQFKIGGAHLAITDSTFSGNSASFAGGGVYSDGGGVLNGTIVAKNTAPKAPGFFDVAADAPAAFSGSNDLIGDGNFFTGFTKSKIGSVTNPLDPMLLPLANNGGPTQTMSLQPNSPAINNGANFPVFNAGIDVTATDQHGIARPQGLEFDIGAYQSPAHLQLNVSGMAFSDNNKNGKQDVGEAGLTGREIYVDSNNNGKLDKGEAFTFTNSTGAYSLALTSKGSFTIRQVVPANWTQTTPNKNNGISVVVTASGKKTGVNFGSFTAIKYLKTVATTSGIVAWWTFDSSSQANSILNGYTGSLAGDARISAAGKGAPITGDAANTALFLNGKNAAVITNLLAQQTFTTAATYNVWINLSSTPAKSGHIYEILAKSQFGNDLDLEVETDGSVHFYTDTGTSTSFKPASLTGWHMLTAEFDTTAKTRKIFWDGKQVASTTPGPHSASMQTFTIGASAVFAGRFFDGSIDEATLWNRALTATEVTAIFNASKG